MPIRLAAFDLDGTLIRDRTCIEAIAVSIGRTREVAAFESLDVRDVNAMTAARGTIAGWFQPVPQVALLHALEQLTIAPRTEEAFSVLKAKGIRTAIVSLTWKPAVEWFARRFGADYAIGTDHTDTGIVHVWPSDKGRWIEETTHALALDRREVAAVGDSDGDREMLAAAGLRIFVGQRPPEMPETIHLPGADMLDVAHVILERSSRGDLR